MPRCPILLALVLLLPILGQTTIAQAEPGPMVLSYDQPAAGWVEAMPVGNGHGGAMVFGGTSNERIQFNEDTLWTGRPRDYSHPDAAKYLDEIRSLLFEGKQGDAQSLASQRFMSVPLRQHAYQPFGDLLLTFAGHDQATDYRRELDIDQAVATIRYKVGDVTYTREVLASYPDRVIAVRVSADKPGALTFTAGLVSPQPDSEVVSQPDDQPVLILRGHIGENHPSRQVENAMRFEARLAVSVDGGKVSPAEGELRVTDATTATLLLVTATNHVNYQDLSADPAQRCASRLGAVVDKPYDRIRADHVADHQALFHRVEIDLGTSGDVASMPTNERIKAYASGDDPALASLYFQFGRYLLIASSRPGSQPANLQGLWNESIKPPWESKYTVNINTEMNYWPAEMCNLSECQEPLFAMIEDVSRTGRNTARNHYDARGWVLHHNTDLWRGTAPINASNHGIWPTGGAWLCENLWYRYAFTGDRQFLAERAYPILKEAALFFADYLTPQPGTDRLVSGPSNSPENGGLVMGPTMDHQIIRSLLSHAIEASEILDVDTELRGELRTIRDRIAPNQIGQHGQLQEWLEDKDNPGNHHRHVSHLWGLHPGNEITLRGTPELFDAARTSLNFRGDGGTGWSKAWKVNFWARLEDGDHAHAMLAHLISQSTMPNMFDTHPPFQIDGNFGGTSGIAEMLLASHDGAIHALPALPSAFPTGSVRGLCARGGVVVDLTWSEGKAESMQLVARVDTPLRLRPPTGQTITSVEGPDGVITMTIAKDGCVPLPVKAGQTYRVTFK